MGEKIVLASRRSRLALKQAEIAARYIEGKLSGCSCEIKEVVTTGDRQKDWSLEKEGGKGLFTKELEEALLRGEADLAVHSAKDLPTTMPDGLALAGFLERGDPRDVLVMRAEVEQPRVIATGSPRRRAQGKLLYPGAEWVAIRGNVETRIEKIINGEADATILAAAGLTRLGIASQEGVVLEPFSLEVMVPAVGQGAIALECSEASLERFKGVFDVETAHAVTVERAFLRALGGGCHVAIAGYFSGGHLSVFSEEHGVHGRFPFDAQGENGIEDGIRAIVEKL